LDKVPVSDHVRGTWSCNARFFTAGRKSSSENGAAAFQTTERPRRRAEEKQKRIEFLEETPLKLDDARRLIQTYVDHYNTVGLHSAIGYVTPADMLAGRQAKIHAARDRKLDEARRQRQLRRQATTLRRLRPAPLQ
jgi:hypothetical protein